MPFAKVYWKGLRLVLGKVIRYITKHQSDIEPNISGDAYTAMIALRNDAEALLVLLPVDTPTE